MCTLADWFLNQYVCFANFYNPGYKNKEENKKKFTEEHYPKFLQTLEDRLAKGTKYLVSDAITLADLVIFAHFAAFI